MRMCVWHVSNPNIPGDSDAFPPGAKGNVIHAVGGAVLCAQRRPEKPPQDRRFWSGDMKLISRHWRGWLSWRCCHLHAVIRPGSWWCRHRRGGIQQKPWSRLNKLSPIPLWWCSSAACADSRNYEPPEWEGRLWLVGRWDASSSIWGVKDTNRLPRVKAPSCFESATTSRHARDGKLFGFFFFDRSGQSRGNLYYE